MRIRHEEDREGKGAGNGDGKGGGKDLAKGGVKNVVKDPLEATNAPPGVRTRASARDLPSAVE